MSYYPSFCVSTVYTSFLQTSFYVRLDTKTTFNDFLLIPYKVLTTYP